MLHVRHVNVNVISQYTVQSTQYTVHNMFLRFFFSITGSFAGLGFLALYMTAKIKVFDRSGHVAKLCILFLPLLMASLVAVSRVDDYWHHWQDVFAGGILGKKKSFKFVFNYLTRLQSSNPNFLFSGLFVATMCYLQFFPAPYHSEGNF